VAWVASRVLWGVVDFVKDSSTAAVGVVWRRAGDAVEATCSSAADQLVIYSGAAALSAEYVAGRLSVKAKRALLPQSIEARTPWYWRGLSESSPSRVRAVPAHRSREILEQVLEPGGSLGGRDLQYKHPEGYQTFEYAAGWRIENPMLFLRYSAEMEHLRSSLKELRSAGADIPKMKVRRALWEATRLLPAELDTELNETMLVHGTSPERVLQIITQGFNERFAGRGLFGQGVYYAEDVAKTDQYVTPDRDYRVNKEGESDPLYDLHRLLYGDEKSHPKDVFYVFICRVLLGAPARTKDATTQLDNPGASLWSAGVTDPGEGRELAKMPKSSTGEPFHSLIAELGGRVVRFREFVSFHGEVRAYPEYLIAYRRVAPRLP